MSLLKTFVLFLKFAVALAATQSRRPSQQDYIRTPSSISTSSSSSSTIYTDGESSSSETPSHYSSSSSSAEEVTEYGQKGCGGRLQMTTSPGLRAALAATNVAMAVGFGVGLTLIEANSARYCGRVEGRRVLECYPNARNHVIGTVFGIEPVHIGLDIYLYVASVVYSLFGRQGGKIDFSSPYLIEWFLGLLAGIFLLGRLFGTIGAVFTLPMYLEEETTRGEFKGAMQTAAGVYMGFEFSFLLMVIVHFMTELLRRTDNK